MAILVELNNKTDFKITPQILEEIFEKTLKKTDFFANLFKKDFEISVALVENKEIEKINLACRKKNCPTDVLSFAEYENSESILKEKKQKIFLGEIIASIEYIKESAKENGVTFEYEIPYIFSHGMLHLLGLEHSEKMFSIQNEVAGDFQK
jgi:probable rRNA maturation factor